MRLNISERKQGTYLFIEKGYRDKETGKVRHKSVMNIGYASKYEGIYDDPIAHFKEVARRMTEDEACEGKTTITIDMGEELKPGAEGTKNLGYAIPLKVYHSLDIPRFLNNKARHRGFEYSTNAIMTMLVMQRLVSPGSKKRAYEGMGRFFERFDFSLDDVYRSLTHFAEVSKELQRHMSKAVGEIYGRDTKTIYYDVTNYYFEADTPDDFRKFGHEKNGRKDPIVQMGLAMDADGVPLHYETFPGNTLDSQTFRSVIGEVRRNHCGGRIVVVADKGNITGDNIYYLKGGDGSTSKNGYVFSFSIRGATDKFKEYVLDDADYRSADGAELQDAPAFKIKSRQEPRKINVTLQNGRITKKTVDEKQVVFWSKKYFDKARAERAAVLEKARDLIANPNKYTKATSYGAAAYVGGIEFDKETGEVISAGKILSLDMDKIASEEKFDGYYAIVTSELDMPDKEIIGTYRGLWEIEETFKITKSELDARPVYVRLRDHIEAHFLTCFIALTVLRVIQKKTGHRHTTADILECIRKTECINEDGNIYLFGYRSEVSDSLGSAFGIDLSKKRLRLDKIKNIIANAKK
jgi:transposase